MARPTEDAERDPDWVRRHLAELEATSVAVAEPELPRWVFDPETAREDPRIARGPSVDEQQETWRETVRDTRGVSDITRLRAVQGQKLAGDFRAPRPGEKPGHEQLLDVLDKVIPADGPLRGDLLGHGERGQENARINVMPEGSEKRAAQLAKMEEDGKRFIEGGPIAAIRFGRAAAAAKKAPVAPAAAVVDAEATRLAGIGRTVEEMTGAKQAAGDRVAQLQDFPNAPTTAQPIATQAGGADEVARIGGPDVAAAARAAHTKPGFMQTAEERLALKAEQDTGAVLGGGKAQLGSQVETFSPQSQPVLREAKEALRDTIAPKVAPISQQDTLLAAQMLGRTPEQVAKSLPKHGDLSTRITNVALGIEEKLAAADAAAAKLAAKGSGAMTMQDRVAALLAMRESAGMLADFAEGASEIGRALNARKIAIQRQLALDPSEAAYRSALKAIGGARLTPDKTDALLTQLALVRGDRAATFRLLRSINRSPISDMIFEGSQGNILWAPSTHANNVNGGLQQHALMAERVIGETVLQVAGRPLARLLRRPVTTDAHMSDIVEFGIGYQDGMRSVARRTAALLSRRMSFDEYADGAMAAKHGGESIRPGGAIPGRAGEFARTPFKMLTVEDMFQTMPAYNGRLRQMANQQAMKEGLGGTARRSRIEELIADPPLQMQREAEAFSQRYALHTRGEKLQATTSFIHDIPGLRYIVRFTTTPTNIVAMGLDHSPVGLGRLVTERGKGHDAQILVESGAIGMTLVGHFLALQEAGMVTGLRPQSKAERDMWEAEGLGPLMIRSSEVPLVGGVQHLFNANGDVKDRWVTGAVLGPLAIPALIAVGIREVESQNADPDPKRMQQAVGAMVRTFADLVPMLQGISTTEDLFGNNPVGAAGDLASSTITTLVPARSLIAWAERVTDRYKRHPEGLVEELQAIVPGLAQYGIDVGPLHIAPVRTKLDVFGRPVEQNTGALAALPRGTVAERHPVIDEARRLREMFEDFEGLTKTDPKKVGTVSVNPDVGHRYGELEGQNKERRLTDLLNGHVYQGADDPVRVKLFKEQIDLARLDAKKQLADELIGADGTPRTSTDRALGTTIGLGALRSARERMSFIDRISPAIDADPDFASDLDAFLRGSKQITGGAKASFSRVIDGDNIAIVKDGQEMSLRLRRVDVAERFTDAGKRATAALNDFLAGKPLTYHDTGERSAGRVIAEVYAGGENVSDWLVSQGLAKRRNLSANDPNKYGLADYQAVIPVIKEVEAMPKYARPNGQPIGDPSRWDEAEKQRKAWDADQKAGLSVAVRDQKYPVWAEYRRYHNPTYGGPNPVKKRFIEAESKRIFGGTGKDNNGVPILAKFLDSD